MMVESLSAKGENGELEHIEEVISIRMGDSLLYSLLRCLKKHRAWCLVSSPPAQPTLPMTRGPRAHLSDVTGQNDW
jgi:hypothetical protein